jgi:hypothetical protein
MIVAYTLHARERMKERGISEDEVVFTLQFPFILHKSGERYVAHGKINNRTIRVVYEKENYLKIITVY